MHTHILPGPLQILSSQTMSHTETHTYAYKTSKSRPGQNDPVLFWVNDSLWVFKMQEEERESDISVASLPAASESSIMSKHKQGESGYKKMANVLKKSAPRFSSGRWLNRARGQSAYVACFCCLLNTAHRRHPRVCQKLAHNMTPQAPQGTLFTNTPMLSNWASWRVIWSCQLPCEFICTWKLLVKAWCIDMCVQICKCMSTYIHTHEKRIRCVCVYYSLHSICYRMLPSEPTNLRFHQIMCAYSQMLITVCLVDCWHSLLRRRGWRKSLSLPLISQPLLPATREHFCPNSTQSQGSWRFWLGKLIWREDAICLTLWQPLSVLGGEVPP